MAIQWVNRRSEKKPFRDMCVGQARPPLASGLFHGNSVEGAVPYFLLPTRLAANWLRVPCHATWGLVLKQAKPCGREDQIERLKNVLCIIPSHVPSNFGLWLELASSARTDEIKPIGAFSVARHAHIDIAMWSCRYFGDRNLSLNVIIPRRGS